MKIESWEGELPAELQEVNSEVLLVDAKMARELLIGNIAPAAGSAGTNRRATANQINRHVDNILEGRWKFTHQGVALDANGVLLDGQHRLMAIIKAAETQADIAVPLLVVTGVPADAQLVIDTGRRRSTSDFLAMSGKISTHRLAAAGRLLYLYKRAQFDTPILERYWRTTQIEITELLAEIESHGQLLPDAIRLTDPMRRMLSVSAAAASYVIIRETYPDAILNEFLHGVISGENLSMGDPRLALRNWGFNRRDNKYAIISWQHLAVILKSFKAWREERPLENMRFNPERETFPRP